MILRIIVKWGILTMVAIPVIVSLIAGVLAHTYYEWQWRTFILFVAGALWTVTNALAADWVWEDVKKWLDSPKEKKEDKKGRPLSFE